VYLLKFGFSADPLLHLKLKHSGHIYGEFLSNSTLLTSMALSSER